MAPKIKYHPLPTSPASSSRSTSPSSATYPPPYSPSGAPPDIDMDFNGNFTQDVEDAPRPRRRAEPLPAFDADPRFRVRTPSPYARGALLMFVVFLFWLAFNLRRAQWVAGGMSNGVGKEAPEVDPSY